LKNSCSDIFTPNIIVFYETFARAVILFSGKEKAHGMREFIAINNRIEAAFNAVRGQKNNRTKLSCGFGMILVAQGIMALFVLI